MTNMHWKLTLQKQNKEKKYIFPRVITEQSLESV